MPETAVEAVCAGINGYLDKPLVTLKSSRYPSKYPLSAGSAHLPSDIPIVEPEEILFVLTTVPSTDPFTNKVNWPWSRVSTT